MILKEPVQLKHDELAGEWQVDGKGWKSYSNKTTIENYE